jgi:hypothetical protein
MARTVLRSATKPVRISASVDREVLRADDTDLAFVTIELVDSDGTLATSHDRVIRVDVSGAGVLQGLGSARPITEERFDATRYTTFDGRALAVIRPVAVGQIIVTVDGEGLEPVTLTLRAETEQKLR